MTTTTRTRTTTIILKTKEAMDWINDNICIARNQWDKDDDTGMPTIEIDSQFVGELLEAMTDDLTDSDYKVSK